MALPTSPVTVTKTLPSYLYFQYQDDPDLPALINAYNTITQEYLDWFNTINLPIYVNLNDELLDWVGQGLYGLLRPTLASQSVNSTFGQIAGATSHGDPTVVPNVGDGISITKYKGTSTAYTVPDGIYKKMLTWWFYKGDGYNWSVPWMKRRIARFLYGTDGGDVSLPFTPNISIVFDDTTTPYPTCVINIYNAVEPISTYFKLAMEGGYLSVPFRFQFTVTLHS